MTQEVTLAGIPGGLESDYREHVAKLFETTTGLISGCGYDGLLISAGSDLYAYRDDNSYPFRVNPYFKAWVPILDRPRCLLWIGVEDEKPRLFYFCPEDIWHKVNPLDDVVICDTFDVVVFSDPDHLASRLLKDLAAKAIAFIGQPTDCPLEHADVQPEQLLSELDYRRAFKGRYELACLRLASCRAALGHIAAKNAFYDGASEFQIHLAYLQAAGTLEEHLPYGNIIALNDHGAILHYTEKQLQAPKESRSFLIDAGFGCGGYAADISRTYARESGLFTELVAGMEKLQLQVIEEIPRFKNYLDLHLRCHRLLAELLVAQKLLLCSADVATERGLTSFFFPHGLGHLLGLQVHDRGGWMQSTDGSELPPPNQHPYLRLTRPIEENMVFTIEPGLYFIPALLNKLRSNGDAKLVDWFQIEALMGFGGIRIEDNICVTSSGTENLTRDAFAVLNR